MILVYRVCLKLHIIISGYVHSGYVHSGYVHSGYVHSGYVHSGYVHSGYVHSGFLTGFLLIWKHSFKEAYFQPLLAMAVSNLLSKDIPIYHPVKPYIKEFCTVIYLISLTTGLISRYQS